MGQTAAVAVAVSIHVLLLLLLSCCCCSTAESWVAAPWTRRRTSSSRKLGDGDGMDLASVSDEESSTRSAAAWRSGAVQGLPAMSMNDGVPALFVFGDSTVDVGNNNHLETLAQATFWPYGKDFDTHLPTGRFCDGRLSVDFIADSLGLPLVPPFASGTYFSQGANFASAGSGVLPDTGSVFGEVIPFSEQLKNLLVVQQFLKAELGESQTSKIISQSVYYISTGSNDFINNYLLPNSQYGQLDPAAFEQLLLASFTQQIRTLFKMGARKIVVVSLSPLGCLPSQLFKMGSKQGECIEHVNALAVGYNALLAESLHGLRRHLPGAKLTYNDAYVAFSDITQNAASYGLYGGMKACMLWSSVCENASDHLFWDAFHPTSTTYKLVAESFWSGPLRISSPWNVQALAAL